MTQTPSARTAPVPLHPRDNRFAMVTAGLVMGLLVLVGGAEHALAVPSPTSPRSTSVAATEGSPAAPDGLRPEKATPVLVSEPSAPAVPGQEATIEIPSLGVSLPVVQGGQDVIDRGVVAHFTGTQWRPPTDPGQPGTYWLAAHNSTHGSPFGRLSAIATGAEIRITELDGTVFTYRVGSRDLVGTTTTYATVYGQDANTSRILLQTCEGTSGRLLVHGTLTSVTSG